LKILKTQGATPLALDMKKLGYSLLILVSSAFIAVSCQTGSVKPARQEFGQGLTAVHSCRSPEINLPSDWVEPLSAAGFTKCAMPFGVLIGADHRVPDAYINHAARIVAELLDPDMDGVSNDPTVAKLVRDWRTAWIPMPADPEPWHDHLEEQLGEKLGSYGIMIPQWWMGEFRQDGPDAHATAVMVEEIVHFLTQFGYSPAYPEVFGVEDWDSVIARETKRASCDWWQHPENACPNRPAESGGDCSGSNCDVTEFFHQVLVLRAGMQPGWLGIDFPTTREELEQKLSAGMKSALDDPRYHQIRKPLTFSYPLSKLSRKAKKAD